MLKTPFLVLIYEYQGYMRIIQWFDIPKINADEKAIHRFMLFKRFL
jgi:CRISPR/Cas system-associated protein endoribonuclease Cas2